MGVAYLLHNLHNTFAKFHIQSLGFQISVNSDVMISLL